MVWKRTIMAKALEKAGHASIKVENSVVFVANVDGKLIGMDAVCSHARCILGELDKNALTVKCPCHHAVFDLNTGKMLEPPFVAPDAPKEKLGLKLIPVRENNGWIEVDVE
jgi:nitrite reductase/ring-hydroxylating ferredoxin subunit